MILICFWLLAYDIGSTSFHKDKNLFHQGISSLQKAPINVYERFPPKINPPTIFKITIQDEPILKNGRLSSTALITHYLTNNRFLTCDMQVKVYLKTDQILFKFADEYLISGSLSDIQAPRNPGEFNFKKFLNRKNIWATIFIDEKNILAHKESSNKSIIK